MNFLNFSIKDIYLETAGQVFDLHNHFTLQKYTQNSRNRVFEIFLSSQISHCSDNADTQVATDLKITFRNTSSIMIQDKPIAGPINSTDDATDETNICFQGMKFVNAMTYQPTIVCQLAEKADEKIPSVEIDWGEYLYIDFIWGVEMVISSETVEVSFHQAAEVITHS
jgi:hypothetical protein